MPKKHIPTVKRRRGRPRKVLTEEERAAIALREANGPRPVGRPRKLPVKPPPPPPPPPSEAGGGDPATQQCHVTASLTGIVSAWMAGAAAQAAQAAASGGLRSVAAADLESHVKALAVSKTKEVTGTGPGGVWTPRMTRIALSGIEAWDEKWKEVFPGAGGGDDAGADTAGEGSGLAREKGGKCDRDDASVAPSHGNDPPAREGSGDDEGVVAAKAATTAATGAAMRPGLAAGKAVAESGGSGVGGDVPFPVASPAEVGSGDGEEDAPPAEHAREIAVDSSASKLTR